MARALLTEISNDVMNDNGGVLWSIVKGEQLEYPIVLNFIQNALTGYSYECVLVEALNVALQTAPPTSHKPGGIQTILPIRVPTFTGSWSSVAAYGADEIVLYSGTYYRRYYGGSAVDAVPPDISTLWAVTALNTVYVQFPSSVGATWTVQPQVDSPSYAFFELRVTETFGTFKRTWKPVRGVVELLFSPTDAVADV